MIPEEEPQKGRPLRIECAWGTSPHRPHNRRKKCCCGNHSLRVLEKRNKLRRLAYQTGNLFVWIYNDIHFGRKLNRKFLWMARMKGGYKRNLTRSD